MIFQFFRKFCWIIFLVVMVVGGGCVSFYCFWHWRVWDGTGGAWACSPRGLHLLQLQSRGSQGHPWTVAHAGNWLHGLGEVVADYPAVFSTPATAGSCPTVTWERRCPYGFIDGLLWDQTETLFQEDRGFFPRSLAVIGKENESMLALKSHPTSPPHPPFLLNLNANLGFPQSPKTAEWLWRSLISFLDLLFFLCSEVCWTGWSLRSFLALIFYDF